MLDAPNMTRHVQRTALGAVRALLVAAGVVVAVATVYSVVSMPAPPPGSEGFAQGMAYVFGTAIVVFAISAAALGMALPSLLGTDDALGFSYWQRRSLQAAGGLVVAGFAGGLVVALATAIHWGFLVLVAALVLAVPVVCCTLVWRLGQVTVAAVREYSG